MTSSTAYLLGADVVLFLHVAFVAFVVLGLALVFAGSVLHWAWIRNPVFRGLHLLAIGVVAVQAWIGVICPLTTLENWLRARAGATTYSGTFVSHWLQALLYYDAPMWVFAVVYTAFAALVAASWYIVPPRAFTRRAAAK